MASSYPPLRVDSDGHAYYYKPVEQRIVDRLKEHEEALRLKRRYRALQTGRLLNVVAGGVVGALGGAILFDIFDDEIISYLQQTKYLMGLGIGFAFAGIAIVVGGRVLAVDRHIQWPTVKLLLG
jgi:hypothetical protein